MNAEYTIKIMGEADLDLEPDEIRLLSPYIDLIMDVDMFANEYDAAEKIVALNARADVQRLLELGESPDEINYWLGECSDELAHHEAGMPNQFPDMWRKYVAIIQNEHS